MDERPLPAKILFPTIRKPGSEIWFTFNPRISRRRPSTASLS